MGRPEYGRRGLPCPPMPKERGPNGRPLCRWCLTEVTGRRTSWCSQKCVDEYLARRWPALRSLVIARDKACRECAKPYPSAEKWEVDHIIPVADGGTDDPENLRLLCRPCHVTITTAWRKQRPARSGDAIRIRKIERRLEEGSRNDVG